MVIVSAAAHSVSISACSAVFAARYHNRLGAAVSRWNTADQDDKWGALATLCCIC